MNRRFLLLIVFAIIFSNSIEINSQIIPPYAWINTAQGSLEEVPYGIAVSPIGEDVYLTGKFQSKPLNMGNGISITHTGMKTYFAAKYNHDGQCVWAHEGGGEVTTEGRALVPNQAGEVIVTGGLYGKSIFGSDTLFGSGNWDVVIVKYSSSGEVLWVEKGSSYRQDRGNSIVIDGDNNIIVAGYFGGSGVDTVNFSGYKLTGYGDRDAFVAKYTQQGELLWVKAAGGISAGEEAWGVVTDAQNNIYVCGVFQGMANFGSNQVTSMALKDAFVAKLSSEGVFQWVKTIKSPKNIYANELALDLVTNQVIVAGYFTDTCFVNDVMHISNGGDDAFLAKYSLNGDMNSFYYFGGVGSDRINGISVGSNGNYFIGGNFTETTNINGTNYVSAGERDIFTAELEGDNVFRWVKVAGGTGNDYCNDLTNDWLDNAYFTGNFELSSNFDGSIITSAGDDDLYIARIGTNEIPVELVSFDAEVIDGKVNLNWLTATETNNNGFEIERSIDNVAFTKIGFVSGNGTTAEYSKYSFSDNFVSNGSVFYRLKQIDNDGSFVYIKTIEVNLVTPKSFSLSQNYPNPFNPVTTIKYQIPTDGFVTLRVFDVLGREIETLVNNIESAGFHQVQFSPKNYVTSGIYFYNLTVNDKLSNSILFSQSQKMMFLK